MRILAACLLAGVAWLLGASPAHAQDRPYPPQGVAAQPGPGSITVTWLVFGDDGSRAPITDYLVTIYPTTTHVAVMAHSTAGSVRFDGLEAGTTYVAHVRAINSFGAGQNSPDVTAVPGPVAGGGPSTPVLSIGPLEHTPSALHEVDDVPTTGPPAPEVTVTIGGGDPDPGVTSPPPTNASSPTPTATAAATTPTVTGTPGAIPQPTASATPHDDHDPAALLGWYVAAGLAALLVVLGGVLWWRRRAA